MRDETNKSIVYNEITTTRDGETGELVNDVQKKIVKVPRTPDFVMLFTKHVTFLEQLGKTDNSVLFVILSHYVGQENLLFLSPQVRKKIASELSLDISSVNKAIKNLIKKEVIGFDKDEFLRLNPHLFGKGNWEDIRKLRQELTFEFDFTNNTAIMSRTVQAICADQEELEKPHAVIDTHETISESKSEQTIFIEEINDESQAPVLPFFESEEEKTNDFDIERLKEENKAKELGIEEMKLKIKMFEMGIPG